MGRTSVIVVGMLLLGIAVVCHVLSAVSRDIVRRSACFKCPISLGVDFSAPGTYTVSFYSGSVVSVDHLGLDIAESAAPGEPASTRLSALQGTYRLIGPDGQAILWGPLKVDDGRFRDPEWAQVVRMNRLDLYLSPATYQLEVSITQGARGLTGVPQRLILTGDHAGARPLMSDLFAMVGNVALLGAALALLPGVVPFVRRKKQPEKNAQ
jgi:hypothetical protein